MLVALCFCGGCEQRVEHADPNSIQNFEALAAGGSAVPTAPASPRDIPFAEKLGDEAAALLAGLPPDAHSLHLFAFAAWHLQRAGRPVEAEALLARARACVPATPGLQGRLLGTSQLIAVTSGGFEGVYPTLLEESDRQFEELTRGMKSVRDSELTCVAAYRSFFRALVSAGRYDEAIERLDALKTPAVRFQVAGFTVRQLARRGRESEVRRAVEIMLRAKEADDSLTSATSDRALCSALALADDLGAAEKLFRSLPKATDVARPVIPIWIATARYSAEEFRPIVDLAAARRRGGDDLGCVRLLQAELEPLGRRDRAAVITAWVEFDEFERAAFLVRSEPDPAMRSRLAALLCRATVDRGRPALAREYAAEFEKLGYPTSSRSNASNSPRRFDVRFASLELATVVPLLLSDAKTFRARINTATKAKHCESLLRAASLDWTVKHPGERSYVPYQEISLLKRVFEFQHR